VAKGTTTFGEDAHGAPLLWSIPTVHHRLRRDRILASRIAGGPPLRLS
ncbi:unnamed protein product, partial [Amoebophrya sp. A25]